MNAQTTLTQTTTNRTDLETAFDSPLLIVTSGLSAGTGGLGGITFNHAEAALEDEDLPVASGLSAGGWGHGSGTPLFNHAEATV